MIYNAVETGNTLAAMVRDELAGRDPMEQRIIANRVREAIDDWCKPQEVPPQPVQPMTDAEAIRFESEPMEFGKYNGIPVKDVPLDYLAWVADAGRRSWRQIHAYLQSNRVKGELRDAD